MDGLDDLSLVLEIKPQMAEADKALRNLTKGLDQVDDARKKIQTGLGTTINSFLSDIGIRLPASLAKIVNLLNVFGGKKAVQDDGGLGGGTTRGGGSANIFGGGGKQGFGSGLDLGKLMGGGEEAAGGADMVAGGEAAAGAEGLGAALGPIGIAVGAAVMGLKIFTSAVITAANKAVQLAALNNPAVAERFQRALLDTEAVLGNRLIPVVNVMTKGMRLVGDILQTILPTEQDIAAAMSELDPVLKDLRDSAADLAPLLKDQLVLALEVTVDSLRLFADEIKVIAFLLKPLGSGEKNQLKSSLGMAASQASTVGIEDISKRAIEAAYGQGAAGPQERSANTLDKIYAFLERELGRHDAAHQSAGERAESAVLGAPAQFFRWLAEFGR